MSAIAIQSKQNDSKQAIQTLRSELKTLQARLETEFFQHKNTAQLLKKQSQLSIKRLRRHGCEPISMRALAQVLI
jgi:[protein-PII] uridylyltransferase